MKKLKQLLSWLLIQQAEVAQNQRESQRTGNPHLATKYAGMSLAYLETIKSVQTLLEKT